MSTTKQTARERAPAKRAPARKATKRTAAKKATTRRASAAKTATKRAPAKDGARKSPARKTATRKARARESAAGSRAGQYTKPELRDRLKARILRGTRGGKAGQWSARKAQLLAHEYEAQGGGYKGARSGAQRHLHEWTEERWTTSDGRTAQRRGGTTRYLPEKAWSKLSPSEKSSTNRKKVEGSRRGRQHVANTAPAKRARRAATAHR